MEITRITPNNAEAFEDLIPQELAERENLLRFGAVSDDKEAIAAMILEVTDEESVDILWLYTEPSYREQGAATELLETIFPFLKEMGITSVQASFTEDDDDIELFLSDRGFLIAVDNDTYSVPVNDIIYSARMDELLEARTDLSKIVSAEDDEVYGKLDRMIDDYGINLEEAETLSRQLTRVALNDEGEVTGCILMSELEDDDLEITYFLNTGANENAIELVGSLALELRERDIDDTRLIFTDPGEHSIRFVEGLTEEFRETYRIEGLYRGVHLL